MAPFVVNDAAVREFADLATLGRWYAAHHDSAVELWIKLHKKGSGLASVTYHEALDVALCWGWIDGIRKAHDENSFLQRYTRRGARSIWSVRNRGIVERLVAEGRMQVPGQAEIDRAMADGRWERAYAGAATIEYPPDLLAAIAAEPRALELFSTLNAQNRFAMAFRLHNLKTAAARTRRIEAFVEMLAKGETLHPNGKGGRSR